MTWAIPPPESNVVDSVAILSNKMHQLVIGLSLPEKEEMSNRRELSANVFLFPPKHPRICGGIRMRVFSFLPYGTYKREMRSMPVHIKIVSCISIQPLLSRNLQQRIQFQFYCTRGIVYVEVTEYIWVQDTERSDYHLLSTSIWAS